MSPERMTTTMWMLSMPGTPDYSNRLDAREAAEDLACETNDTVEYYEVGSDDPLQHGTAYPPCAGCGVVIVHDHYPTLCESCAWDHEHAETQ
jgi:ABC-type ATPase with predicted acetyltransferase domain